MSVGGGNPIAVAAVSVSVFALYRVPDSGRSTLGQALPVCWLLLLNEADQSQRWKLRQ